MTFKGQGHLQQTCTDRLCILRSNGKVLPALTSISEHVIHIILGDQFVVHTLINVFVSFVLFEFVCWSVCMLFVCNMKLTVTLCLD